MQQMEWKVLSALPSRSKHEAHSVTNGRHVQNEGDLQRTKWSTIRDTMDHTNETRTIHLIMSGSLVYLRK